MIISYSKKFIFIHPAKCAGESVEYFLGPKLPFYDIIVGPQPHRLRGWNVVTKKITGLQKHSSAEEVSAYLSPRRYKKYFSFSIVRHPERRLISYYNYLVELFRRQPEVKTFLSQNDINPNVEWRTQRIAFLEALSLEENMPDLALTDEGQLGHTKFFSKPPFDWPGMRAVVISPDFEAFVHRPFLQSDTHFRSQCSLFYASDGTLLIDRIIRFENLGAEWDAVGEHIGFPGALPRRNTSKNIASAKMTTPARSIIQKIFQDDYDTFDYA